MAQAAAQIPPPGTQRLNPNQVKHRQGIVAKTLDPLELQSVYDVLEPQLARLKVAGLIGEPSTVPDEEERVLRALQREAERGNVMAAKELRERAEADAGRNAVTGNILVRIAPWDVMDPVRINRTTGTLEWDGDSAGGPNDGADGADASGGADTRIADAAAVPVGRAE